MSKDILYPDSIGTTPMKLIKDLLLTSPQPLSFRRGNWKIKQKIMFVHLRLDLLHSSPFRGRRG